MHELLISEHESCRTKIFDKDYYVILPELKIDRDYSHLDNLEKVNFKKKLLSPPNFREGDVVINCIGLIKQRKGITKAEYIASHCDR